MAVNRNNSAADASQEPGGSKVYKMVTKAIIQAMLKGELPWRKTFTTRGRKPLFTNYVTGKPYSLLNCLLLGTPGEYATFKQISDKGGSVRKGSKSKFVIYWGEYIPAKYKEEAKRLEEEGKDFSHLKVRFPKYYNVFNVADADGLKPSVEPVPETVEAKDPTGVADMVARDYTINSGVNLDQKPDCPQPAYDAATDTVEMPEKACFTYEEDYYAALMAQCVHSTASEDRCNRKREYQRLQDEDMSVKEELTAEIASSMILMVAGMKRRETHEQIAAECQKWIREMENDYRLMVNAASGAEKAAKYILGEFAE